MPIAGPFGGAPSAIKSILSGYNFGIPLIPNLNAMEFTRRTGTTYWLFPLPYIWNDTILVYTQKKNYTSSDYRELLSDANLLPEFDFWEMYENLTSLKPPNVPVLAFYGYNVSTDDAYVYSSNFTLPKPISASGDGTVTVFSR
jgi:hypothetical protein